MMQDDTVLILRQSMGHPPRTQRVVPAALDRELHVPASHCSVLHSRQTLALTWWDISGPSWDMKSAAGNCGWLSWKGPWAVSADYMASTGSR